MFDHGVAALTLGSRPSFEQELRALLDYYAPVTRREPLVPCELGEEFGWHTAHHSADVEDGGDGEAGVDEYARVWDAQFAAGAAALAEARDAAVVIGRGQARQARALAGFARSRPVALDRPDAEVGPPRRRRGRPGRRCWPG